MHIDWIHTFLELVETRNFNQTAENMGLTQSTVTHRIQKLEETLGQRLFMRGRSGASLTPIGEKFESHARSLQREWEIAKRQMEKSQSDEDEMRLGIQYDVAKCFAGDIVRAIHQDAPKKRIFSEVDYSQQMCQDVLRGRLEFALIFNPFQSPDLFFTEIAEMNYYMMSTAAMSLADIDEARYVFPNYAPRFAAQHQALLPQLTRCKMTSGQADTVIQFVLSINGASYVPAPLSAHDGLHLVKGAPVISQQVFFCTHIKNKHNKEQMKTLRIIQSAITCAMT